MAEFEDTYLHFLDISDSDNDDDVTEDVNPLIEQSPAVVNKGVAEIPALSDGIGELGDGDVHAAAFLVDMPGKEGNGVVQEVAEAEAKEIATKIAKYVLPMKDACRELYLHLYTRKCILHALKIYSDDESRIVDNVRCVYDAIMCRKGSPHFLTKIWP